MFAGPHTRARSAALVVLALLPTLIWAAATPASAAAPTPTTGCPTPQTLGGYAVSATIATPGAKPRTLDESQATAFLQTWLAYSVYENPPQEHPPANLPVSTLTVSIVQDGSPSPLTIFYATDGTSAWVGAPAPAPVPPPPNDQKWIRAPKPAETIAAFNGTMAPICVDSSGAVTTAPGATTTSHVPAVKADGTSSDNGTFWILVVVVVLVVAAAAIAVSRIRKRRTA
jgi:hypothetical protein